MQTKRDTLIFCIIVAISLAVTVAMLVRNQRLVAHTQSDMWQQLAACSVKTHYLDRNYSITYTPEVESLNGKPVLLDGFVLPLESTARFHHFLLSVRSPSCPYCPAGAPNEMIEVFSTAAIAWSDQLMTLKGTFTLMGAQNDTGIFFQLKDASIVSSRSVEAAKKPGPVNADSIHSFVFTQLSGDHYQRQMTTTLMPWDGAPRLVLFWRSDCAPCLKEIAELPSLAKHHPELPILLLSLQDVVHTQAHLPTLPKNVHVLVAQVDGRALLNALGNDRVLALPFSAMLDAKGRVCGKRYGIMGISNLKEWRESCSIAK